MNGPLEKLLLRQVHFTRVNVLGLTETLFNVKSKLAMLEISDCSLGNINFTFLRADAWHAKIINNDFTVSQEKAFVIKANNLSVIGNNINTNLRGTLELRVSGSLHIQDNLIQSSEDSQSIQNIFQLDFDIIECYVSSWKLDVS